MRIKHRWTDRLAVRRPQTDCAANKPRALKPVEGRAPGRVDGTAALGAALILAGIASGALLCRTRPAETARLAAEFIRFRQQSAFRAVFGAALRPLIFWLGALFLAGTSLAGICVMPLLLAAYGMGLGMALGALYQTGTAQALVCAWALILPHGCCAALLLLIQARESAALSVRLLRGAVRLPDETPPAETVRLQWAARRFCARGLALLAAAACCALVQSALSVWIL